jgi:hypothetical protein
MQETRRKDDVKINKRIDAIIVDLDDCRKNVHYELSEISEKVASISDDLATHKNDVSRLSNELRLVSDNLKSIHDILSAWNDTKGFINVMKFFAGTAKVLTPILFLVSLVTAGVVYLYHRVYG